MKDKNLSFSIKDGEAFFSHESTINFNPFQFIFDFKCVTPRIDVRSRDHNIITIAHNVVMMDIYQGRKFYEVLGSAIKKYEKEFGKITKPKILDKVEKKSKKTRSKKESTGVSYFG